MQPQNPAFTSQRLWSISIHLARLETVHIIIHLFIDVNAISYAGVGPMTVAMLLQNTFESAKRFQASNSG